MAQSDLTIENQSFPSFRADLNNALTALNSMHSGTSRPASAVAGTMWLDTTNATNPVIKFFDGTDDINFATVDYSANTINFSDSATDLLGDTTPQLGGMLDVNGQAIGDGTLELIKFLETASAVNEITIANADTTNAPEISATGDDTNIDLKLTPKGSGNLVLDGIKFPNADGTANQVLQTNGSGVLSFASSSGGIAFQSAPRFANFTAVAGEGYFCDTLGLERTVSVQSVGGSNKFFIGGVQQPTLELVEGNTYVFNYPSAHPFAFSETSDGTHGGGVEYTTGVTRDTGAYTLTYVVPTSAPTLYYYCSTHSGMGGQANTPSTQPSFTVTLPSTPNAGQQVQLIDYARTWGTNAVIINQNSSKFQGATTPNPSYDTEGQSVTLVYSDSTQGWIPTVDDDVTYETPQSYSVDFLVIAGGGGGGSEGAGGGAGGYRTSTQTVGVGTAITVTVGDGGAGGSTAGSGSVGSNSSISGSGLTTITSAGGGYGGGNGTTGGNGGSGGGGGNNGATSPAGSGNTPSTVPSQGNNGGSSTGAPYGGGGGGGAGGVGGNKANGSSNGGTGGTGTASSITGSSVTRAGGGGGGHNGGTGGTASDGGGAGGSSANGASGTANTGGGAGGGGTDANIGGTGGKGVVILSVPTANYSSTTTGSPTVTTSGSNTIMQFNGSGSYTA